MGKSVRETFPDAFKKDRRNNIAITINIDKEIIHNFREYCDRYGMLVSRRIEILIKNELENPTYK